MRTAAWITISMTALGSAVACGSKDPASASAPDAGNLSSDAGDGLDGFTFGGDGGTGSGDADAGDGACGPNLTGVVRDFHDTHPDFEQLSGDDRGMVEPTLGADGKPVYASATTTATTSGRANFDQWYRDVPNVNVPVLFAVPFTQLPNGVSTYNNPAFFPIDNQGFGNEGRAHNFHFTFELHTEFIYRGGEVFTFTGDDDLWTFVNNRLAIDLGGVHVAQTQSVNLDTSATTLGLQIGQKYPLDVFQAERHTVQSQFRIDTTIAFTNCAPILR